MKWTAITSLLGLMLFLCASLAGAQDHMQAAQGKLPHTASFWPPERHPQPQLELLSQAERAKRMTQMRLKKMTQMRLKKDGEEQLQDDPFVSDPDSMDKRMTKFRLKKMSLPPLLKRMSMMRLRRMGGSRGVSMLRLKKDGGETEVDDGDDCVWVRGVCLNLNELSLSDLLGSSGRPEHPSLSVGGGWLPQV